MWAGLKPRHAPHRRAFHNHSFKNAGEVARILACSVSHVWRVAVPEPDQPVMTPTIRDALIRVPTEHRNPMYQVRSEAIRLAGGWLPTPCYWRPPSFPSRGGPLVHPRRRCRQISLPRPPLDLRVVRHMEAPLPKS